VELFESKHIRISRPILFADILRARVRVEWFQAGTEVSVQ